MIYLLVLFVVVFFILLYNGDLIILKEKQHMILIKFF